MKKLIATIQPLEVVGNSEIKVSGIEFDSRKVSKGSLFVAVKGTLSDGHNYIDKALELGAVAVVCQSMPSELCAEVLYIRVEDSAKALALLADAFFEHPSRSLKLVGVTGTNGKTTTATLLHSLFTKLGHSCGLLSTVVNIVGDEQITTTHTTPDPMTLNALLRRMVDAGCEYCFMEVSSHSVVQHRVTGLYFVGGVFTNLTHDHLDYHKTFAEYLKAKKTFFDNLPKEAFALTNIDDKNGEVMLQNCKAHHLTYSLQRVADYHCRIIENSLEGMLLGINSKEVWVQFIGRFNGYNMAAIYGTAMELGLESQEILRVLSELHSVAGRMECVRGKRGILGIVDYAHTPDALENVLSTINEFNSTGTAKIITVVGCGGDRDATKRPIMARIAADMSDQLILTSDNPRGESPQDILTQMQTGLTTPREREKTLTIESRHQAIRTAAALASKGDIILIAGKGHETYQEIQGVRHHFDDKEEILQVI